MFDFLIGLVIATPLGCLSEEAAVTMDKAIETQNSAEIRSLVSEGFCARLVSPVPFTVTEILDEDGKILTIAGTITNRNGNRVEFFTHMGPEVAKHIGLQAGVLQEN